MNKEIIITKEIEPLKNAKLTEVSLEITPGIEFEKWEQIGLALKRIRKANMWWLGDWLNYGERKYGEMYTQALEITDYDYNTLAHLKQTADKVEISRRRPNLSFSHHMEVKGMEPKDQEKWLGKAEEGGWDRAEMRKNIKKIKQKNIGLPEGKYEIIYADPPWRYWEGGEKNQSQHYKTLEKEDIINYTDDNGKKISELSSENCILFLWATYPALKESIEVMEGWGFEYSTVGFVWVKSKKDGTGFAFGNGSWTRANTEICLIGTKGSIERKDKSISQIIYLPRGEHSEKPDIIRDKIVKLVGNLPRIELFGRKQAPGWNVWGNQI